MDQNHNQNSPYMQKCIHSNGKAEIKVDQNYFCLSENCKYKGQWYCDKCVTQFEKHNHFLLPQQTLEDYLNLIIENTKQNESDDKISQHFEMLVSTIEKFKTSINKILNDMIAQAQRIQQSLNPKQQIKNKLEEFKEKRVTQEQFGKFLSEYLTQSDPQEKQISKVIDASSIQIKYQNNYVQLFLLQQLVERFKIVQKIFDTQDLFKYSLTQIIPRYSEFSNRDQIKINKNTIYHLRLQGKQKIILQGFFFPAPIDKDLSKIKYNLKLFMNHKLFEEQKQTKLSSYESIEKEKNQKFIYIKLINKIVFEENAIIELKQEFSMEFCIPKVYQLIDNDVLSSTNEHQFENPDVFTTEFAILKIEQLN